MAMTNEQFFAALWTHSMQDAIDWQEAAEFEGRVAAKLADSISNELNFVSGKNVVQEAVEYRGKRHKIAWARLKLARLEVEEEMDADRK